MTGEDVFLVNIMCFVIPLKIKQINNNLAKMEDGRLVKLGPIKAQKGDYLQVYADVAVKKLTDKEALSIRGLIKKSQ